MRQAQQLVDAIAGYGSCAVAFSAGVDSAVVVKAAHLALQRGAVAVTGVGPALAEGELDQARELAALIGVRHEVVATHEIDDAHYVANAPDRCFHCKTELYAHVVQVARRLGLAVIVNGANLDDRGDYRPGMQAAADFSVRSPLIECGLGKAEVRAIAKFWGLPVWDKPAAPCLASRIAYGVQVTPDRLGKIDQAEQYLRALGFAEVRVRCLPDEAARIDVPLQDHPRLTPPSVLEQVTLHLHSLGFTSVAINPEGLQSGSLNNLLPADTLAKWEA